ncbi:MAG: C39 family peptidase [Deltaproteobacteria bacterium]
MKTFSSIVILSVLVASAQSAFAEGIGVAKNDVVIKKSVKSWLEHRDENLIRQRYDYSCGSASLATLMNFFFDEKVGEIEIVKYLLEERGLEKKKEVQKEDFALSFQDLKEYAETRGYKAFGLALPLESLKELKVPAILYVEIRKNQHFTVYRGMDANFVYLADPSFGNIKFKIEKFKEIFYTRNDLEYPGKLLVLVPQDESKKENLRKSFMSVPERSDLPYEIIQRGAAISLDNF